MSRLFSEYTDKITVAAAASINSLPERMVMCWLKRSELPPVAGKSHIVFCKSLDNFNFPMNAFYFNQYSPPTIYSREANISNTNESIYGSFYLQNSDEDSIPIDGWAHVAVSYSESGDRKPYLYINGVKILIYDTQAAAASTPDDSAKDLVIGSPSVTSFAQSNKGLYYDFRVYDTVLSEVDLATIVAGGISVDPSPANLVCQLTFATDEGSTEPDISGNNNTGAISGPTFDADSPFGPGVYSVPDNRNYGNFPNDSRNVQDTLIYDVPSVDSRTAGAPVDSRTAGAPVDSRVAAIIPLNSRNLDAYVH